MTSPQSNAPVRVSGMVGVLWPEPAQMHNYLDRWVDQLRELEHQLNEERSAHAKTVASSTHKITELERELATTLTPIRDQMIGLQERITELERIKSEYEKERESHLRRMCSILEVMPTKTLTMDRIINDIIVLVDETKEQFRMSL